MVKTILTLIFLFHFAGLQAQEFSRKQLNKLESFGIDSINYSKHENGNVEALNEILKKDRSYKKNKIIGFTIGGIGAAAVTSGVLLIMHNNQMETEGVEKFVMDLLGGTVITTGVIAMGVSIPIFATSRKRKEERNQLILTYK
jgi:hypothetical protein